MDQQSVDKFKTICTRIKQATPPAYKWQWDDRFDVALISFDKADKENILSAVLSEFMKQWDHKSIGKAAKQVQKLVKSIFDIKPGQLIFTTDESMSCVLLAAWWPWGDGSTFSIRVGIFSITSEAIDENETKSLLAASFQIAS